MTTAMRSARWRELLAALAAFAVLAGALALLGAEELLLPTWLGLTLALVARPRRDSVASRRRSGSRR